MSETNGFKVIDIPLASAERDYGKIVKTLLGLPEGKAIEVTLERKKLGNLHTVASRNQIKIKTRTIRDGVRAVWVIQRPSNAKSE